MHGNRESMTHTLKFENHRQLKCKCHNDDINLVYIKNDILYLRTHLKIRRVKFVNDCIINAVHLWYRDDSVMENSLLKMMLLKEKKN